MITIFNGRSRGLGKAPGSRVYAQIDISFRDHLHLLKGPMLAVFLAIALHADEEGWAWPSYETLQRETGYSETTIINALAELCRLEIQGHRVLLRYQPVGNGGRFTSNRYLIFPSPEEVAQYERAGVNHLGFASRSRTVTKKFGDGSPSPNLPMTVDLVTNHNHDKPEPDYQEEEEEEKEKTDKRDEIAQMLQEHGVFPENAARIAVRMAEEGLTVEEAMSVYLATLQQITQQAIPDEQAIARAVYRLEEGVWDAGERAREVIRRARHGDWATRQADRQAEPGMAFLDSSTQKLLAGPAGPEGADLDELWQAALGELQLQLTRATFETWLQGSRLVACEDGVFVIGVANSYAKGWLESRLRGVVERVLTRLTGRTASVRFVVAE